MSTKKPAVMTQAVVMPTDQTVDTTAHAVETKKDASIGIRTEDTILGIEEPGAHAIPVSEGQEGKPTLPVAVNNNDAPLVIVVDPRVTTIEFNGAVSETEADKVEYIRAYLRNKVLKQFGAVEVDKNPVMGGKIYFNSNRTSLVLPRVKETPSGAFAESPIQYYNRVKPQINKWLQQSYQNSGITMEMVGLIAG